MDATQAVIQYKPLLHSIALRMVGSISDAEDIVQDTFLKWLTVDRSRIENTKAYLVRSVTNNCINHLKSLKSNYIDKSIDSMKHSELAEYIREIDIKKIDLDHEVEVALHAIHKKLEPLEKSIFILREFFNVEYEELQEMFDKSAANCRKLFSRAKAKLSIEMPSMKFSLPTKPAMFESFQKACNLGSLTALVGDLKSEIREKLN